MAKQKLNWRTEKAADDTIFHAHANFSNKSGDFSFSVYREMGNSKTGVYYKDTYGFDVYHYVNGKNTFKTFNGYKSFAKIKKMIEEVYRNLE